MDLETLESIKDHLNLTALGKPALIGIAVILALVAVAAGRMFLETATANQFEISKVSEEPAEKQTGDEAEAAPSVPASVFVHVTGEVKSPGLCEVAEGARVGDAVQAAGGFTDEAAIDSVNLARTIADGEQIVVASRQSQAQANAAAQAQGNPQPAASASSGSPASPGLVNINTATADQLKTLPGVGDATSQKIIDERQANGPFKTKEDLKRVSGIGDKTYEKLSSLICV